MEEREVDEEEEVEKEDEVEQGERMGGEKSKPTGLFLLLNMAPFQSRDLQLKTREAMEP